MLKLKNLKIQVLINVLNDNDFEAFKSSDLKSELVIFKQSESSEKMSMNELEEQLFAVYFNDEWVQIMITALRNDQQKLKEFSLAKCMLQNDWVYYKDKLLILEDEKLWLYLLQLSHDTFIASHSERVKIYKILSHHC